MTNLINVTLVDDNQDYCSSMEFVFEEIKEIKFTAYRDAHYFLEKNENWNGFLLIDLLMPGIDGMTLLQTIRERNNQIYIIVISGHADQTMAEKAIALGADEFLLKPFSTEELVKKLLNNPLQ